MKHFNKYSLKPRFYTKTVKNKVEGQLTFRDPKIAKNVYETGIIDGNASIHQLTSGELVYCYVPALHMVRTKIARLGKNANFPGILFRFI